ncbi:hypothetical protein [Amycolatopsis sp. NPDC049868]|uniref:hypothetical protein n=1 Tax=Amycolatopsis sp. NPDC049868 TaxID=3363934 RepID=UPI0037B4A05C
MTWWAAVWGFAGAPAGSWGGQLIASRREDRRSQREQERSGAARSDAVLVCRLTLEALDCAEEARSRSCSIGQRLRRGEELQLSLKCVSTLVTFMKAPSAPNVHWQ